MNEKKQKILMIVLTVIMFIRMLPPMPVRATAIVASPDIWQLIVEGINIIGGIDAASTPRSSSSSSYCMCNTNAFCSEHETSSSYYERISNIVGVDTGQAIRAAEAQQNVINWSFDAADRLPSNWNITEREPPPPPPGGGSPLYNQMLFDMGTIPYVLMATNEDDLESILGEHALSLEYLLQLRMEEYLNNSDRPEFWIDPLYENEILGFVNGIPVIDRYSPLLSWYELGREAAARFVFPLEVSFNEGSARYLRHVINVNGINANRVDITMLINGREETVVTFNGTGQYIQNFMPTGFFIESHSSMQGYGRFCMSYMSTYDLQNRGEIRTGIKYIYTSVNYVDISSIQQNAPAPTIPQNTLRQPNIIESPEQVMQAISDIADYPGRENGEVVIMIPLITPEFFPEIPPELFTEFAQEILDNLRLQDLIMPGYEAMEIIINLPIIPSPRINTTKAQDYSEYLERLNREQQRQTGILEDTNLQLRSLPERILGSPSDLDFSAFDDIPSLSGLFPFSIPWDLKNAIIAMFGGSIDPRPAPVVELDLTNTIFKTQVTFDMADYEILAMVVRWGVMVLFVIGLIKSTGLLIKW